MDLMKQMMATMQAMQGGKSNTQQSVPQRGRRNPNQSKYCWTHGLCSHTGSECRIQADGHDATATVTDRKGGSTKNVPNM